MSGRLRRLAAALAAVIVGLLASAATIPAAFAREVSVPPAGSGYELGRFGPVPATISHAAAIGGMPGWQITLIAVRRRASRGRRHRRAGPRTGSPSCRLSPAA